MRELAVVVGTRPEIIKMAPVIRAAEGRFDLHVVHTGQHYDDEMSGTFFESLDLPTPDENLAIGSGTQAEQTAQALVGIESMLSDRDPAAAVAQGDTNAVLSTALAASKLPVAFGHVEAGLRSFDRTMPEEVNRVVSDHVADFSFAPTEQAVSHLEREGLTAGVVQTGNTVVDACREHVSLAEERSDVRSALAVEGEDYVVATIHRPSNTDDSERLQSVVDALDEASAPVILPAHPRTKGVLDDRGYDPSGSLRVVDPLDYLDFLNLLVNARVAVTDSGGIQEEASILEVPCLTVRPNTERPETVEAGVNELVEPDTLGPRLETLLTDDAAHAAMTGHPDLYGDGNAGERIVDVLDERV